jgi:hypothetical protein
VNPPAVVIRARPLPPSRAPSAQRHPRFIVDENFSLHPEASSYLLVLADGRRRSINTVRAYAGRVARFPGCHLGQGDRLPHDVVAVRPKRLPVTLESPKAGL